MPVLETESCKSPRSVLRYRPIGPSPSGLGPVVAHKRRSRPDRLSTTAAPVDGLDLEEELQPLRKRRIVQPVVQQKGADKGRVTQRLHPVFFMGIGFVVTILLWMGITQLMIWSTNEYNTIMYGYPRTFQIDQVVGHHDSPQKPSHFIAMNLKGHIIVIEMPSGDISKSMVFSGPTLLGSGEDLTPVTLTFQDAHHDNKPNMIIRVQGNEFVFLNENGTSVPSS